MKTRVNIGDCYCDSAVPWNEWRVERIYRDHIGLPHAVMSSLQDPTVSRTIACLTLGDRRRFQRSAGGTARRTVGVPRLVAPMPVAHSIDTAVEAAA